MKQLHVNLSLSLPATVIWKDTRMKNSLCRSAPGTPCQKKAHDSHTSHSKRGLDKRDVCLQVLIQRKQEQLSLKRTAQP